ncbi:hypothetical protein, partial [Kaistella carnis]|uniref:hypothetical protein n=1 Tax=Kaistella carnis TaxID=1241979 RepID=UPI00289D3BB0
VFFKAHQFSLMSFFCAQNSREKQDPRHKIQDLRYKIQELKHKIKTNYVTRDFDYNITDLFFLCKRKPTEILARMEAASFFA